MENPLDILSAGGRAQRAEEPVAGPPHAAPEPPGPQPEAPDIPPKPPGPKEFSRGSSKKKDGFLIRWETESGTIPSRYDMIDQLAPLEGEGDLTFFLLRFRSERESFIPRPGVSLPAVVVDGEGEETPISGLVRISEVTTDYLGYKLMLLAFCPQEGQPSRSREPVSDSGGDGLIGGGSSIVGGMTFG